MLLHLSFALVAIGRKTDFASDVTSIEYAKYKCQEFYDQRREGEYGMIITLRIAISDVRKCRD